MSLFLQSKMGIRIQLSLLVLLPLVLLLLPATSFDGGPPLCLYTLLADMKCIGCGLTRGVMHLIHFDFAGAWSFNPLSFLIVPIGGFLWIRHIIKLWRALCNPATASVYSQSSQSIN